MNKLVYTKANIDSLYGEQKNEHQFVLIIVLTVIKGCENVQKMVEVKKNWIKTNRKMKRNSLNTINIIQLEENNDT